MCGMRWTCRRGLDEAEQAGGAAHLREAALLYEPPFTGIAPTGPEHLFDESRVVRLFETIKAINESAVA